MFDFESLSQVLYEEFSDLLAQWRETDAAIESWAAELTPEILASDFCSLVQQAKAWLHPSGHAVAHLFNHQTYHRGQVTALLSQLGRDPGITDFMVTAFMPESATEKGAAGAPAPRVPIDP